MSDNFSEKINEVIIKRVDEVLREEIKKCFEEKYRGLIYGEARGIIRNEISEMLDKEILRVLSNLYNKPEWFYFCYLQKFSSFLQKSIDDEGYFTLGPHYDHTMTD